MDRDMDRATIFTRILVFTRANSIAVTIKEEESSHIQTEASMKANGVKARETAQVFLLQLKASSAKGNGSKIN